MSTNSPANALVHQSVTSPAVKLTVSLNPEATSEQALATVDNVCNALARQEASAEHLRVLLGRLLAEVQDRNLYSPKFQTFESFMLDIAERYRMSRSSIYGTLMIARQLPSLDPADVESMPLTNLALVARVAKKADAKTMTSIMKDAKRLPVTEFRARMENRGLVGKRGRPTIASKTVTIKIRVSRAVANRWANYVGDSDPASVFASLVPAITRKAA